MMVGTLYYLFLYTHFYCWVINLFLLSLQEFLYVGDIGPSDTDFLWVLLIGSSSPIKKSCFVLGSCVCVCLWCVYKFHNPFIFLKAKFFVICCAWKIFVLSSYFITFWGLWLLWFWVLRMDKLGLSLGVGQTLWRCLWSAGVLVFPFKWGGRPLCS